MILKIAGYLNPFERWVFILISLINKSFEYSKSQTNQTNKQKFKKMEEAEAVEFSPSYRILEATDESEDDLHHSSGRTK